MRNIFPNVKGAAKAIAHGQAIISTDVKTFIAFDESINNQYSVAIIAILSTAIVNRLLMALVNVVKLSSLFLLNTSLLQSWVK